MKFLWRIFKGKLPDDIARAWAYTQEDSSKAIGSVFEMKSGRFKVIYSIMGQFVPTVDGPFMSLRDAQEHMEFVSTNRMLRSRVVLLAAEDGFM